MPDETLVDHAARAAEELSNGRPERATAHALLALADEVRGLREDLRQAERRRTVSIR